jgi:hypothetical protein
MIIIEGKGTLSVTEPGHSAGTYYEHAEITIYGDVVVFIAHGKHHTAATTMCLIGWDNPPTIRQAT